MVNLVVLALTPTLVTGMPANKGFTLIEILVVILIIGITLGFALLAFGDFGGKRRIIIAAEQFTNYVKLVQQQAILETRTLGIKLNNKGYQVVRFESSMNWQPMPSKGIFRPQHFPDNLVLTIKDPSNKQDQPSIIINAMGDTTPFTLDFGTNTQESLITLQSEPSGTLTLKHHE